MVRAQFLVLYTALAAGLLPQVPLQSEAELRAMIPARRQFAHADRVVNDPPAADGAVTVWVLPGSDDLRLYTPKGGQMEMDFQVKYALPPGGRLPQTIEFLFETHGETMPGSAPHGLALEADGRPVGFDGRAQPARRSGRLVFHAIVGKLSLAEFLRLVNASRVQGRWLGHAFVFLPAQLEILRDLASRMGGTHPESPRELGD